MTQKKKNKILFLVALPPPTHGAAIMNQHAVQSATNNQAFECKVIPLKFADSVLDIGNISPKKLWRMLLFSFRLFGTLISFRPRLVYFTLSITGGAFYRDAVFALIIKCFPARILYHLHGKGLAEDCRNSRFKRVIAKTIFKNEKIIILGNSLRSDIAAISKGEPYIVPNSIAFAPHEPRRDAGLPVFLYLSNLIISKGIGLFLESLDALNRKGIKFEAIIGGASYDMTEEEVRKYISEHHLEEKVKMEGPLYGEAKQQALMKANILVLPTWYKNEAAPLTILEAMQAEMAVISTDNGAIGEMIDNAITGYVVPQKDGQAITEKMEELATNEALRNKMGSEGRKKFLEKYTLTIFQQNLSNILQLELKS